MSKLIISIEGDPETIKDISKIFNQKLEDAFKRLPVKTTFEVIP